jgi:hypothetical protein
VQQNDIWLIDFKPISFINAVLDLRDRPASMTLVAWFGYGGGDAAALRSHEADFGLRDFYPRQTAAGMRR